MPSQHRPNVVVFAGAGASKALPETNFPTTVEFFESLPPSITDNTHFQFLDDFLRSVKDKSVIDIEDVLLELQSLIAFLQSANDQSSIIGRAVASNLINRVGGGWNFGQLQGGGTKLSNELEKLQGQINAQVYRLYSKEPTDEELEETWNPLLRDLIDNYSLNLFTTNYDLVIENSIQSISNEVTANKWLGATGRQQKRLDLSQWREDTKRSVGLLTKLHGSLNWKLDEDDILLGDWAFTGNHAKQAIIYPGFKGASSAVFFDPFHDYLTRTLARADHVLVVGFAFRDDAINQIFRASLNPSAVVTVMDPNKTLDVPTRRKPKRVDSFNAIAVREFLDSLAKSPRDQGRRFRAI